MEKNINPILKRLSEFADTVGGFAEVGRRIQKHPSMFYNLVRRDAMPSLATLSEIADAFPELDMNYVIRGIKTKDESEEIAKLKYDLSIKDATITKLVMPGKSKGATFRPDTAKQFRIDEAKKAIVNARSTNRARKVTAVSSRVQGVKVPSLVDLFQ